MTESPRRFGRYLAEFVVIFLGVSLSFVADDLREARGERQAERTSLERLVLDFQTDLGDFPGNLDRTERGLAAIDWFLEVRLRALPSRDSLNTYLNQYVACSGMFANTSEYESMKASGGLNKLRDIEFRQRLTEHYERYPVIRSMHDEDCRTADGALALISTELWADAGVYLPDVAVVGSVGGILTDPDFMYRLASHRGHRRVLMGQVADAIDRLEWLDARARSQLSDTSP